MMILEGGKKRGLGTWEKREWHIQYYWVFFSLIHPKLGTGMGSNQEIPVDTKKKTLKSPSSLAKGPQKGQFSKTKNL